MPALSAPRYLRRLATEIRGLAMRSLMGDADTSGSAATTSPTQSDAWRQQLVSERENLIAARAKAVRQHRPVCSIDARLRAITTEMLRGH